MRTVTEEEEKEGVADVYEILIELIGLNETKKVFQVFRGQQISFPKHFYRSDYIGKLATKKYNGLNLRELAQEFDYTERHLRNIIKSYQNKGTITE